MPMCVQSPAPSQNRPKTRLALVATLSTVSVLAILPAAGCYTRVVKAKGFGADQYQVSEPYQENSQLDDWVFGERPVTNNSRLKDVK